MSNSIGFAADPSWLAPLRLRSGAHLRLANSASVLAAPRDPGGSTAIIDRFTHSRTLRHCPETSRSAVASQPGQLAAFVLTPSVAVPTGTALSVAPGALAICSGLLCLARRLVSGQCLTVKGRS